MLMLNSQAWTIEGIQVFADHADARQFWYLPGPVQLTRRREDGRAEFTFIKVRAADAANAGAKGAGFLTFSVDLRLDPELERRILSKLSAMARGKPRLSAVPFDEGSVRVIALDLDSGATGSPGAAAPPAGAFRAVERALGATVPSLDAVNRASFSLTLSQEGAIIVEQAFRQGGTPVGVIYELKYSGMRPALDVTITADMSRVFEQFAGSVDSQVMFVRGGIDAGFEKLVQDGAIRIEVHDFIGATDRESKETWALNFFKESLLAQYFTPTLTVGELRGGIPQTEGLDAVLKRGEALRPAPTPAPSRPTGDEVVSRPGPPANPAESPTAGTGRGGTQPGRVAQPSAGGSGESPTDATGQAAGAATGAALGSSAAAGVSPAVAAGRPPGSPAGATTGGAPSAGGASAAGGSAPPSGTTAGTGGTSGGGGARGASSSTSPATTSSTSGAAPTQGGGAQAVTAFRFRGIKQEERKKLVFRYTRSEAAQRTYAPQGFFGLLAGDLDKKSHFIEVDLDDPFFRKLEIRVSTIPDFAAIGLRAAEIALSYGKPGDPGGVKSQNLRFEGQNAAEQAWTVFQNDGDVQSLRYTAQFHFDPASGFEGSQFSYEFGPFETTDRTIVLNPFEHVGIRTISAVANKIDWGQIERVEVALTSGRQRKTLTLSEAAKEAIWKLRLDSPDVRAIGYSTTFVMKDRTTRAGEAGTTEASSILVDDPFPEGLSLQLIPILDAARTRLAFVDLDYSDPPSGFKRSERFRIAPTDLDREVRVGLPKGATKSFRFRVTVVPKTGAMRAGAFVDSTETLIAVSD